MALKARQYELIDAMMATPLAPDTVLARKLGINNKTVGVWRKNPEFQAELKSRIQEKWKDAERIATDTMISLASSGDFKAAKYILDSFDYAPAQKIEADVKTDIIISIDDEEEE